MLEFKSVIANSHGRQCVNVFEIFSHVKDGYNGNRVHERIVESATWWRLMGM